MGVKREELFKSLLNEHADELLTGNLVYVARMDEERVEHLGGRIKGLPGTLTQQSLPRTSRMQWAGPWEDRVRQTGAGLGE
jgi:hypothetical protein